MDQEFVNSRYPVTMSLSSVRAWVTHPPRPLFAGHLEAGKADLKECGKGVRAAGNLVWVVPVVSWAGALPETSFPKTENE
jgi:hypothetical protein